MSLPLLIELAQAAAVPASVSGNLMEFGAIFLLLAAKSVQEHWSGKKRDSTSDARLNARLNGLKTSLIDRIDPVAAKVDILSGEVRDVKAHVVGPDGKNGLRGELREFKREVKERFDSIDERERERLERAIGAKDRRSEL